MPPPPSAPATADEVATIANWIAAGSPAGTGCGPTCTSGRTWTGGNEGSPNMNPGMACIQCHASDEGPRFSIAGTAYPTIAEPDLCYGAPSSSGAQVVITGADGRVLALSLNGAGNFFSEMAVAKPYHAKVVTARRRAGDDGCSRRRATATVATRRPARTARRVESCCRRAGCLISPGSRYSDGDASHTMGRARGLGRAPGLDFLGRGLRGRDR